MTFRFAALGTPLFCAVAAGQPAPAPAEPPTVLPEVNVTGERPALINPAYEKLNHLFEGPFPSLRSGPLIEAILWRHRYLESHPAEKAVIVTTQRMDRVTSATTVYSDRGRLYASSSALGERRPIDPSIPVDLDDPANIGRLRRSIAKARETLAAAVSPQIDSVGKLMVEAEESGDYRPLLGAAGPVTALPALYQPDAKMPAAAALNRQNAHQALAAALVEPFGEPSGEILAWTYTVLHDPNRAGIVPVALSRVVLQPGHPAVQSLVFDWEGVQYLYNPDAGTFARPIPRNPLTGLPYLCVKNGASMEAITLYSAFARSHPDGKAALVPDPPAAVALATGGKFRIIIPAVGSFVMDGKYAALIDNPEGLRQLRGEILAGEKARPSRGDAIPDGLPGDDADLQLRRVYLALRSVGITSTLNSGTPGCLRFSWEGRPYLFGPARGVQAAQDEP